MLNTKRDVAFLIPYKVVEGKVLVYIQKRDKHAVRAPDQFSFFGGGLEGTETPEHAMLREIKEELDYQPKNYHHLGRYQSPNRTIDVFYTRVSENFEKVSTVIEGEYGIFLSQQEIDDEPKFIETDRAVVNDFFKLDLIHKNKSDD